MATKKAEIYLCHVCGTKVEVLEPGLGVLVCCAKPMRIVV